MRAKRKEEENRVEGKEGFCLEMFERRNWGRRIVHDEKKAESE